ncbi:DNA adenine methylase [uncultured Campylobacter sp.]|uniref:DNA adenine methylase n=1 Tax=uncultured Campylobacter sp. TaxID=218934 RepID=UPI002606347A|nr:DNA adenine methylase [uncultured Campylobacter sp.]
MRYIGNKEKLIPIIHKIMQKYINLDSNMSFFDVFAGSASVGKYFKKEGFKVASCDLMYFSYCLQRAYLGDCHLAFDNLKQCNKSLFNNAYLNVLEYLNELQGTNGFIYKNYAPSGSKKTGITRMYFSDSNAKKIDSIRIQIEKWRLDLRENEYYLLLATLIESVSLYANITGVYGAFCKQWDNRALKDFKLKPLNLIEGVSGECFCGDSFNILNNGKYYDILYLDPPYNHRQYAPNYHLLETIAKYDNPSIKGIAGLRDYATQKSRFCNVKTALNELEKIVNLKKYRYLILSYNSEGLMKKEEIDRILKNIGKVELEEIVYPRFKSQSKSHQRYIKEYVWVVERQTS